MTMPTPSPGLIDAVTFAALQQTTGAEFVAELVETFAEELPGMLVELQAAAASQSAPRFRRAAHSLKTNAMTFGAIALAEDARALELAGPPSDDAPLRALQAQADAALAAMRTQACG